MTADVSSYRQRAIERRYARRAVLRGAALASAGLAGAATLACAGGRSSPARQASPVSKAGPAASLVGRTGSPVMPSETPARGGTFVHAVGANPQGLDPQNISGGTSLFAVPAVMSRLFHFKLAFDPNEADDRVPVPDLAASAESPDAVTWTFKLRPEARFHNIAPVNGHSVEAEDVRATFERAVSPGTSTAGGLAMVDASQIQTPDRSTIVFKLEYPFSSFPTRVSSMRYGNILPREVGSGAYDPKTKLIGSGRFIWGSYTPDVGIVYRRNPDFYEKGRPYIDGVKSAIIPDFQQQLAQFTAGQIDELRNIPPSDITTFQRQIPTAETITNWGQDMGLVYYKVSDPASPFKDPRLRQAVSLALDRDTLAKLAYDGRCIPAFYSAQLFGKWALKMEQLPPETARWYRFDPAQAKVLASAAGAAGLSITYLSPTPYPTNGETAAFKAM